jgi:hypothetical protein
MVSDRITLSDGKKYKYSLNRTNIDFIQSKEGIELRKGLDSFCKEIGVTNKSSITLLLRGVAAGNTYFEQNLSHGFAQTIRCDDRLRAETMSLLIEEQIPEIINITNQPKVTERINGPLKDAQKKWRQIKAELNGKDSDVALPILNDFMAECSNVIGSESLVSEIKEKMDSLSHADNNASQIDLEQIKSLERKWREVKATAKAKIRVKDYFGANEMLTAFLDECSKKVGTDELIEKINAEIANIQEQSSVVIQSSNNASKSRDLGAQHKISKVQSKVEKTDGLAKVKDIDSTDKGVEYIKQWKIKEARDWYRDKGDSTKSRILSEVIRSKKGVDLRKNTIDECRKNKNAEQIKRIISELSEFIGLCDKVGLPSVEYKKLISDYRKIK